MSHDKWVLGMEILLCELGFIAENCGKIECSTWDQLMKLLGDLCGIGLGCMLGNIPRKGKFYRL